MIGAIDNKTTAASTVAAQPKAIGGGGFNAALEAAQKAAQREKEHQETMEAIRTKGFTDWARDTQIEKLKEELRKKVMAAMGVTEDELSKMGSAMQQILEQKIQEEVERQLEEVMAKEQGDKPTGATATAAQSAGKNDLQGKKCPLIPALAWPGGASVL